MSASHLLQTITYDLLLINYDSVYYIVSILQYGLNCCKSAYFLSIFLQLEEVKHKKFQNKSPGVLQVYY